MMRPSCIILHQPFIQVLLQLGQAGIDLLPEHHLEEFIPDRSMEPFAETVGVGGMDLGIPMLNLIDGQVQLIRMRKGPPAEFPAIIGQNMFYRYSPLVIERQHVVVEHIHRRHRGLGQIQLAEAQGAEGIHHALQIDPAHALDRADVVGVLAEQITRTRTFNVGLQVLAAGLRPLQEPLEPLGQNHPALGRFSLQPQKSRKAGGQAVPLPRILHRSRRDAYTHQFELIGQTQVTVGRVLLGHRQDLPLQLRRDLVGHLGLVSDLRHQPLFAKGLIRFFDLIEMGRADSGQPTGPGNIFQFIGQG